MSSLTFSDYTTAAAFGFDVAAVQRTVRDLYAHDEPLRSYRDDEDAAPRGPRRARAASLRETAEAIAHDDLAGHVAAVPLGKAPKVTGTQLEALLAYGPGAAVLLTETNDCVVVDSFDVEDPDAVPVVLFAPVKARCAPEEDEEGNRPPAVKPATLAQTITLSLRKAHSRCALNPVAA